MESNLAISLPSRFTCLVNSLWKQTKQRATWHVPKDQVATAESGAAAELVAPVITKQKSSLSIGSSSKNDTLRPSSPAPTDRTPSGIDKDVALKIIPKKKVKGNEASVWGEMEVLKGLNHPNIVRPGNLL